jgi:phosphoribosylaminoimidazolecarboxamide formyltransferase / IMP cyclohydrolase
VAFSTSKEFRLVFLMRRFHHPAQTISKPGVSEAEVIEEIDIGGVTLLRAAAKNFESVASVCDPADYASVLEGLKKDEGLSVDQKKRLALKAFRHTAAYDAAIASWFSTSVDGADKLPEAINLSAEVIQTLRYGENPHQQGALYKWSGKSYPFEQLQGKELSYNNILDVDAAWAVVEEFADPACCIIKHNTPCGIATAATIIEAYNAAYESDTVSAFGGIIAVNRYVYYEF